MALFKSFWSKKYALYLVAEKEKYNKCKEKSYFKDSEINNFV